MRDAEDLHAARRMQLLVPVARMCAEDGVAVRGGVFRRRSGPAVYALLCAAGDNSWDAAITVVRARRVPREGHRDGYELTRNPREGYDLDSTGEIAYEVRISEDDDGGGGHGARPVVAFRLSPNARAAADELILWTRRSALFQTAPPVADPRREARRERRCFDHREASAAQPRVRVGAVPDEAAHDVAAIDHATLSWHFPRDRTGRNQRSAVLALASYGGLRPHLRGRWLTVRADGDGLLVAGDDLIGANQRHRWDVTPWLWDRRHAGTPVAARWQVARPARAATLVAAVRRGAVAEALATAGVRVDEHLVSLLAGRPNRSFRAALTTTWVPRLYAGLAELAPWRLAAAHQAWRGGRAALGLPAREPIVLFGLGGVGRQRKPKVALDMSGTTPMLRLVFTGSNAVLARSLWTVPADLGAHLRGWQPSVCPLVRR
jgi:hypothetical protein